MVWDDDFSSTSLQWQWTKFHVKHRGRPVAQPVWATHRDQANLSPKLDGDGSISIGSANFDISYVTRSHKRVTKSLGRSQDNLKKHHLGVIHFLSNLLFLMFSHCRASVVSYSYCSQPILSYKSLSNTFQIAKACHNPEGVTILMNDEQSLNGYTHTHSLPFNHRVLSLITQETHTLLTTLTKHVHKFHASVKF